VDRTLAIANRGDNGLVPTFRIVPVDADGKPVPGVRARAVLGSDRGLVLVPPRSGVLDVVPFDGNRRYDVETVRIADVKTREFTPLRSRTRSRSDESTAPVGRAVRRAIPTDCAEERQCGAVSRN